MAGARHAVGDTDLGADASSPLRASGCEACGWAMTSTAAHIFMAYMAMAYIVMAYMVMVYMVMAYMVIACTVTAYAFTTLGG